MTEPASTLGALFARARARLREAGIAEAGLEARLLVEHFTRTDRTAAIADPDRAVAPDAAAAVDRALDARMEGRPVHRILGWREFFGLRLTLSPETLEPRPDTETLVERVVAMARRNGGEDREWRILDLGTGTGAVALALLSALPGARAVATDISAGALATARHNAHINGYAERLRTLRSDWFATVEGRFDFVVSNPPYIGEAEWRGLAADVRDHDPRAALVAGRDGLKAYRAIAQGACNHLSAGGVVAVEIGFDRKRAVGAIFAEAGYRLVEAASDLAGRDRTLIFAPEAARGSA